MLNTTYRDLVLPEFSDEGSKFPQIICGKDQTLTLGSCPCLGNAYYCTFKLREYAIFHLVVLT